MGGAEEGPSRNFLDESCNYGPSLHTGGPGALGNLAIPGVRSYLCMDGQSQGLEVDQMETSWKVTLSLSWIAGLI